VNGVDIISKCEKFLGVKQSVIVSDFECDAIIMMLK